MNLSEKLQKIKAVILDVDGTMTDSGVAYGFGSDLGGKLYSTRDGLGITCLHRGGILVGFLTGRHDPANQRRGQDLKLDFLVDGIDDKAEGFSRVCDMLSLQPEECLYMGDDLNDMPAFRRAGVSCAVGDASPEIRAIASFTVKAAGGHGAVREMAETLLKAQNKWSEIVSTFDR